jgi:hypothetical protein
MTKVRLLGSDIFYKIILYVMWVPGYQKGL